jgi:hypothetical protein
VDLNFLPTDYAYFHMDYAGRIRNGFDLMPVVTGLVGAKKTVEERYAATENEDGVAAANCLQVSIQGSKFR